MSVRVFRGLVGAAMVSMAIALAGCAAGEPSLEPSSPAETPAPITEPSMPEYVYFVDGIADGASITMKTATGSQQGKTTLPMKGTDGHVGVRGTANSGDYLYISAQNVGETGFVRCRILVDGKVVSENTSEGAYVIATCEATVP